MQPRPGIGAQAHDVARVGRDLGMDQDDVEHASILAYPGWVLVRAASLLATAAALTSCAALSPDVVVPQNLRAEVRQAGSQCPGVDARLIAAQVEQESGWDRMARSPSGAQGIAQFMPQTWSAWGRDLDGDGAADPFNAREAIDAQARLMCFLYDEAERSGLPGDPVVLALAAYNAGWGPVQTHGGVPPFPETKEYVAAILELRHSVRFRG